jgi:hypothetical protein
MPHYNRAPITEALIDIRIEPSTHLKLEDFQPLKARLADYPKEETRNLNAVTIQFGAGISQTTEQKPWALVLRNADNNQVMQFSLNGFTFSRLNRIRIRTPATKQNAFGIFTLNWPSRSALRELQCAFIVFFGFPGDASGGRSKHFRFKVVLNCVILARS